MPILLIDKWDYILDQRFPAVNMKGHVQILAY